MLASSSRESLDPDPINVVEHVRQLAKSGGALSMAEKRAVHRLVDASDEVQRAGAAALVKAADGGPVMRCLQSDGTPVSVRSHMAAATPRPGGGEVSHSRSGRKQMHDQRRLERFPCT